MADAGYVTVFNQEHVKIYDAKNTRLIATRAAVINGWRDINTGMWRVDLLPTEPTNQPTTDLPMEAIHNVYELTTQPELIRYYTQLRGTQPSQPGSKPSKINNSHHGLD